MSDSTTPPRSRTKRRMVVGSGVIAGLIALGIWLSSLIPGLGLGLGGGSGAGLGNEAAKKSSEKSESPPTAKPRLPDDVVTIRIDGKKFLMKQIVDGKTEFRPATQSEIIQQAKRVTGNDRGIKVKFERLGNAVLDVEDQLKNALKDAGLKEQEMPSFNEFQ